MIRTWGFCLAVFSITTSTLADEPSRFDEIYMLARLGREGEAERLARGSKDPLVASYWAVLVFEEAPSLRARGVTKFDPEAAQKIAT